MSLSSISGEDGGATPLAGIHPDILQSHILNRLDGPTLAAASCASAALLSMCSGDHLWKNICTTTWPSTAHRRVSGAISAFHSGHRSFYSDAFPSAAHARGTPAAAVGVLTTTTGELISAVDIYYNGALVYSRVLETEARSAWFLSTPFRVELLEEKETVALPLVLDGGTGTCIALAEERLRVSWIVIDPARKRAVNVASRAAVEAGRHWLSDGIQLRYSSVAAEETACCSVTVSCGGEEGGHLRVKEVSMVVEDVEGKLLNGAESLRILAAAMEGERRRSDERIDKVRYQRFLKIKGQCRERKLRRERGVDMVCAATGISIFFAFITFIIFR